VWADGESGLHWETLVPRLAQRFPEAYAALTKEALSALVRALDIDSRNVTVRRSPARVCTANRSPTRSPRGKPRPPKSNSGTNSGPGGNSGTAIAPATGLTSTHVRQ